MEGRDAKALVLDVSNFISYASNYRDATITVLNRYTGVLMGQTY